MMVSVNFSVTKKRKVANDRTDWQNLKIFILKGSFPSMCYIQIMIFWDVMPFRSIPLDIQISHSLNMILWWPYLKKMIKLFLQRQVD